MNSRSVSRREAKANRDGFLFSLPWLIGFLLFSLYPIVMSAYYSFTDFSAIKDPVWVGLKNYQDLLKDKLFWQSLQNTILYVVISVPVTILVSLLLAALLKVVRVGKAFFRSVFFLPSIFPVVASTMIWLLILDSISGYLNLRKLAGKSCMDQTGAGDHDLLGSGIDSSDLTGGNGGCLT